MQRRKPNDQAVREHWIRGKVEIRFFLAIVALALTSCGSNPPRNPSTLNRINEQLKQDAQPRAAAPLPQSVSNALLPPLKMPLPKNSARRLEQRFDLVISDAPASQVFMGVVSGTRYSMLVHPEVQGNISVNLKDVTVFEALDAIRDLYGYDYRVEGSRIFVMKAGMQSKIYKVNYIAGIRRGSSDISVTSGASGESVGNALTGSTSRNSVQQASKLNMSARTDFWGDVEDGVRTIIGCKIPGQSPSQTTTTSAGAGQLGSTSRTNLQSEFVVNEKRDRGNTGCPDGKSVVLNQVSGTIFVRAMPDELRTIEQMLRAMQLSIEKQVILEAKIIDVQLNNASQQGINWAAFQSGAHRGSLGADTTTIGETGATTGGVLNAGTTLGGMLGTGLISGVAGTAFSAGLGIALQLRNFSALINFLETQGEVHVLSSPRIATLNNQKAVLKVGKDEQYVTGFDTTNSSTTTTGGTVVNQPTPVYSTFFSGISLDVTPQIDDDGNITLHVHPLVSEVTEVEKRTINNQLLPFASNKISETDSVVKVRDGQIVVIGGLMTDSYQDTRSGVPGVSKVPAAGAAFRKNGQQSTKRELVIMIKPTIVHGDEAWAEEISAAQQRIQNFSSPPGP